MERKQDSKCSCDKAHDNGSTDELQPLEKQENWDGRQLVRYRGFWFTAKAFQPGLSIQKHFKAKSSDIILASMPKSGTTWLKALAFSIANRNVYTIDQSPLLTSNPHALVPFLEFDLYLHQENPDLEGIPTPKIFATHMPFEILPHSVLESKCRILYISRNPLDQFISHRHFLLEKKRDKDVVPLEFDEAFELFCQRGVQPWGPCWDHILGYWDFHLKSDPRKILFLKYEDLNEDITSHIKKIAEFMGFPFSLEEEKQGLIEQISRHCSFENLSILEANKTGHVAGGMKNSSFFRKREVGDWTNNLTPAMAEGVKKVMETKFEGSGLTFKT